MVDDMRGSTAMLPFVIGLLGACDVSGPADAVVASVLIAGAETVLVVGESVQLTATPISSEGDSILSLQVSWKSTAPATATVTTSGMVRAVAAGIAEIRATVKGVVGSYAVTVVPKVAGRFVLRSLGGQPLPLYIAWGPTSYSVVRWDTLRLFNDLTYRSVYRFDFCTSQGCPPWIFASTGEYRQSGLLIILGPQGDFADTLLLLIDEGYRWLEAREWKSHSLVGLYSRDSGGP